jgi:hypothetical protein
MYCAGFLSREKGSQLLRKLAISEQRVENSHRRVVVVDYPSLVVYSMLHVRRCLFA